MRGMVSQQTVNLWLKSIGGSSPSQRIIILANCSITEATMKNHSYTKESLSEAVAQSKSVIGVLRFLGVALTSGGVHNHVTKRIKEFGLDTSHFRPWTGENIKDRQRGLERKKNWQDVLVLRIQGTRCKSYMLRRAMIESGIDYKCRECGLSQWRGKPCHWRRNTEMATRLMIVVKMSSFCARTVIHRQIHTAGRSIYENDYPQPSL